MQRWQSQEAVPIRGGCGKCYAGVLLRPSKVSHTHRHFATLGCDLGMEVQVTQVRQLCGGACVIVARARRNTRPRVKTTTDVAVVVNVCSGISNGRKHRSCRTLLSVTCRGSSISPPCLKAAPALHGTKSSCCSCATFVLIQVPHGGLERSVRTRKYSSQWYLCQCVQPCLTVPRICTVCVLTWLRSMRSLSMRRRSKGPGSHARRAARVARSAVATSCGGHT
jgi:hypothetical protein